MSESDNGFHFTFGADDALETPATHSNIHKKQSTTASLPAIALAELPVLSLTSELLTAWAARYPAEPLNRMELHSAHHSPLLYQRAPRVPQLTASESRDIVPGKYYGGLKVWSCAPDLVEYVFTHSSEFANLFAPCAGTGGHVLPSSSLGNAFAGDVPVVMEVGCGQGLPGIAALLSGARQVIFQDYNAEVLELCVKPNLAVNILPHATSEPCVAAVQLVAGDWDALRWHTAQCNVVFGSDVTFDEEACEKLAGLLQRCLSPVNGVAFIASKEYYFGTNGGALEFTRRAESKGLVVSEVWRPNITDGMQRLIMRVAHRK